MFSIIIMNLYSNRQIISLWNIITAILAVAYCAIDKFAVNGDGPTTIEFQDVFCTSETFSVQCSSHQVIIIRRAVYGRLSPCRCITSEYSHAMGCYADVTVHVKDVCSGRQSCSFLVATIDAVAQPCGKDFKSYLDVTHRCVTASFTNDCTDGNHTILSNLDGYLAFYPRSSSPPLTLYPSDSQPSTPRVCPWVLISEPGRRYNISWHLPSPSIGIPEHNYHSPSSLPNPVFEASVLRRDSRGHRDPGRFPTQDTVAGRRAGCAVSWAFIDLIGDVLDAEGKRLQGGYGDKIQGKDIEDHTVHRYASCMSALRKPRERTFLSRGSKLEVRYTGEEESLPLLSSGEGEGMWHQKLALPLLHYSVFGCKEFPAPLGAIITRHIDGVVVTCRHTMDTWYVTCHGGEWTTESEENNCTKPTPRVHSWVGKSTASMNAISRTMIFSNGVMVAIVVGVALGATAGILLLAAIVFFKNRRWPTVHTLHRRPRKSRDSLYADNSYPIKCGRHDKFDDVTSDVDNVTDRLYSFDAKNCCSSAANPKLLHIATVCGNSVDCKCDLTKDTSTKR